MVTTKGVRILAGSACALALLGGAVPHADAARRDPIVQAMDVMIDDERRTGAEYERIVRDHGRVAPFDAFASAERAHVEFIAYLYRDRSLPVPQNRWNPDNVRAYRSVAEACAAGYRNAMRTAELYDRYLEGATPLPDDVRRVFRHNRNVAKHDQADRLRACAPGGAP